MTIRDLDIGFIGGGNMAQAIIGGLLRAGQPATALAVAEPDAARRSQLARLTTGMKVGTANAAVAATASVLVLAVKPQVMPAVLADLAGQRRAPGQLVLSVAAGVPIATLAGALGADTPIVRIMPNQPALVGAGMSVLVAGAAATASHRALALELAQTTGRALWLEDESLMDAVTAVSGSGPAYFYLLMELMEDGAIRLGLPPDIARTLVRQTALGAARSAADESQHLAGLRAAVTSPGGTTAAALAVMEQAGLGDTVRRALAAARDRGAELGRGAR
ncbi:MAG: pyrroline-5-carboxylate reductase [Gammaproteobacteria bacterium]|nr:pyrroline-5-carboxylate reductase [Gammaproteobacteria bacterium]QOJ30620.1 MAG: pyrroline-5-carboxylate reductase [Gammaproteobacteria bacterium]